MSKTRKTQSGDFNIYSMFTRILPKSIVQRHKNEIIHYHQRSSSPIIRKKHTKKPQAMPDVFNKKQIRGRPSLPREHYFLLFEQHNSMRCDPLSFSGKPKTLFRCSLDVYTVFRNHEDI